MNSDISLLPKLLKLPDLSEIHTPPYTEAHMVKLDRLITDITVNLATLSILQHTQPTDQAIQQKIRHHEFLLQHFQNFQKDLHGSTKNTPTPRRKSTKFIHYVPRQAQNTKKRQRSGEEMTAQNHVDELNGMKPKSMENHNVAEEPVAGNFLLPIPQDNNTTMSIRHQNFFQYRVQTGEDDETNVSRGRAPTSSSYQSAKRRRSSSTAGAPSKNRLQINLIEDDGSDRDIIPGTPQIPRRPSLDDHYSPGSNSPMETIAQSLAILTQAVQNQSKLVAAIAAQPKILEPELPPLGGVLENHAPASTIHNAPT